MRVWGMIGMSVLMVGCTSGMGGSQSQGARAGMGQYQRPIYMQPEPTARFPQDDLCRSRLYLGLVGQHEGGIVFATLPGRTRVVKPADTERNRDDFFADMRPEPPMIEVREYLSGQVLYAPAIRAIRRGDELGPIEQDRLTVELDALGYVTRLSCR